jgi:UDP-N-acetylmuramoyl-L-alanyl-D-glutamate--2,6-diaminopimelate ligase
VAAGLETMSLVPGRLQRVTPDGWEYTVLVDYAHTDDALDNVLSSLRPLTEGRLIVLFGCGGDRDRLKRARMAKVAARWADQIIVTSDNPRTEDPNQIIREIKEGFTTDQLSKVYTELDRRQAIAYALEEAGPGDIVLLAGKGHENYQIIGKEKLDFDDTKVATEVMARIEGGAFARKDETVDV